MCGGGDGVARPRLWAHTPVNTHPPWPHIPTPSSDGHCSVWYACHPNGIHKCHTLM